MTNFINYKKNAPEVCLYFSGRKASVILKYVQLFLSFKHEDVVTLVTAPSMKWQLLLSNTDIHILDSK